MQAEELDPNRCPGLEPSPSDADALAFLAPVLMAVGYTEDGLRTLVDPGNFSLGETPAALWRCGRNGSSRARLAALWLLNENLGRADIARVLGESNVQRLVDMGLLRARGDVLTALVDLFPCERAWVFTDHGVTASRPENHVYELGADSYTLARAVPRRRVGRVLDLCTGSGIHAILAALHSDGSVGVDINPRALAFSRVNAALNGVQERTRFVQGDLYEAVPGEQFDLVVSNPPWIATPDSAGELYRWGGETGETITRRIVEGARTALAPGGTLAMYVIHPVIAGDPYPERVMRWLGGPRGWGVAVADLMDIPLPVFVRQHMAMKPEWGEYIQEFWRWLGLFSEHGIEAMRCAMVYVRRLEADRDGYCVEQWLPVPSRSVAVGVEAWLDALERAHDPRWPACEPEWRPQVAESVERILVDLRSAGGRAEPGAGTWMPPHELDAEEVRLVRLLDGTRTVRDLIAEFQCQAAPLAQAPVLPAEPQAQAAPLAQAPVLPAEPQAQATPLAQAPVLPAELQAQAAPLAQAPVLPAEPQAQAAPLAQAPVLPAEPQADVEARVVAVLRRLVAARVVK